MLLSLVTLQLVRTQHHPAPAANRVLHIIAVVLHLHRDTASVAAVAAAGGAGARDYAHAASAAGYCWWCCCSCAFLQVAQGCCRFTAHHSCYCTCGCCCLLLLVLLLRLFMLPRYFMFNYT
jgi:hypothetical protein